MFLLTQVAFPIKVIGMVRRRNKTKFLTQATPCGQFMNQTKIFSLHSIAAYYANPENWEELGRQENTDALYQWLDIRDDASFFRLFEEYQAQLGLPKQATEECRFFIDDFCRYHNDSITRLCSLSGEGLQFYPPPQAKWLAQFQEKKIRDSANKAYDKLLDFLQELCLLWQEHLRGDANKKN